MSLTSLPLEVLEAIMMYVDATDLVNVWKSVGFDSSETFWRKMCEREGYKKDLEEDESWRDVFVIRTNWLSYKNCVKREYEFITKTKMQVFAHMMCAKPLRGTLCGENLILDDGCEVSVWNIDDGPKLIQTLPGTVLKTSNSNLLLKTGSDTVIYSLENREFYEIVKTFPDCKKFYCEKRVYCLSDEFFAVITTKGEIYHLLKIINLRNQEEFSENLCFPHIDIYDFSFYGEILNIVLLLPTHNLVLKSFNLHLKHWLFDLLLFDSVFLEDVSKIMTDNIIVAWYNIGHSGCIRFWDRSTQNEIRTTFSNREVPHFFWVVATEKYVILSVKEKNFYIWHSIDPNNFKVMERGTQFYNGQSIVSSSLLVLSYSFGFKVVDFKQVVYLYEVRFETPGIELDKLFLPQPFFVSKKFYIGLLDTTIVNVDKACKNKENKYIMSIYDFRAEIYKET
ncbi:uncharacterized protein LOC124353944 [Homalodisca vitripennis]|uniref:uncharacterized protein LOC124353944 n=1 Tax=Homalodisca vitripennis TaxID=197043 RepID=UPI001EEC834C|nr:uncharacterized protein LOC124353944 [Homalodisca vitripennis]XP_046659974.1 uncharacterized protein LOC124353944 [Homalodisca vitripennis]KAG8257990.1 hypothetical protein J6590_039542 [Homalodisca vitripennis]